MKNTKQLQTSQRRKQLNRQHLKVINRRQSFFNQSQITACSEISTEVNANLTGQNHCS